MALRWWYLIIQRRARLADKTHFNLRASYLAEDNKHSLGKPKGIIHSMEKVRLWGFYSNFLKETGHAKQREARVKASVVSRVLGFQT